MSIINLAEMVLDVETVAWAALLVNAFQVIRAGVVNFQVKFASQALAKMEGSVWYVIITKVFVGFAHNTELDGKTINYIQPSKTGKFS